MPTNLIRSRPPIPFHDVNDRKIEEIVGTHTRAMWMKAGTPTARPRTSLSRRVRTEKRRRRLGAPAAFVETAMRSDLLQGGQCTAGDVLRRGRASPRNPGWS